MRSDLPRAFAADGGGGLGVGGEYGLGSCQTTGAGPDGLWGLQERLALFDEGAGETVRAACAGERGFARAGVDQNVVAAGRDCRSALRAVRCRPGCGRETIPGRPAVAARDGPAGRRGARRSFSGLTAGEIHHRSESRYWRDAAGFNLRFDLIGAFELWSWPRPGSPAWASSAVRSANYWLLTRARGRFSGRFRTGAAISAPPVSYTFEDKQCLDDCSR